MRNDPMEIFAGLIARELRGMAIRHLDLLERRHYVAQCVQPLQDRLATLDESQRVLIRECVVSCVETGIDQFLQELQEAEASVTFADHEKLALADVENLVKKVFSKWAPAD